MTTPTQTSEDQLVAIQLFNFPKEQEDLAQLFHRERLRAIYDEARAAGESQFTVMHARQQIESDMRKAHEPSSARRPRPARRRRLVQRAAMQATSPAKGRTTPAAQADPTRKQQGRNGGTAVTRQLDTGCRVVSRPSPGGGSRAPNSGATSP